MSPKVRGQWVSRILNSWLQSIYVVERGMSVDIVSLECCGQRPLWLRVIQWGVIYTHTHTHTHTHIYIYVCVCVCVCVILSSFVSSCFLMNLPWECFVCWMLCLLSYTVIVEVTFKHLGCYVDHCIYDHHLSVFCIFMTYVLKIRLLGCRWLVGH